MGGDALSSELECPALGRGGTARVGRGWGQAPRAAGEAGGPPGRLGVPCLSSGSHGPGHLLSPSLISAVSSGWTLVSRALGRAGTRTRQGSKGLPLARGARSVLAWFGASKTGSWKEVGNPSFFNGTPNNSLLGNVQRNASNLLVSSISKKANTQRITQADWAWPAQGFHMDVEQGTVGSWTPCSKPLPPTAGRATRAVHPSARLQSGQGGLSVPPRPRERRGGRTAGLAPTGRGWRPAGSGWGRGRDGESPELPVLPPLAAGWRVSPWVSALTERPGWPYNTEKALGHTKPGTPAPLLWDMRPRGPLGFASSKVTGMGQKPGDRPSWLA